MSPGPGRLPDESATLREAVAVTAQVPAVVLRLHGELAFPLLDRLSTAPLYLREGELRQTLLLTETGQPFADALIASEEDGFFLLAEGPSEAALLDHIRRHAPQADAGPLPVEPLGASHALISINGPYAWELASALLGPAVLGMTYLSLLRAQEVVCFRAGRTGEYGYDLLIPRDQLPHWLGRIEQHAGAVGARPVGLEALDLAALENWQFTMRGLGAAAAARALGPIELQLQWRVGYDRAFVGAEALRERRAAGPRGRVTAFTAPAKLDPGEQVLLDARPIGEILASGWSHLRKEQIGVALIETSLAHPGIDLFQVPRSDGPVSIRTCTPPLLNNRSLYVDPHRHSYATREADSFPPLVLAGDDQAGDDQR